MTTYWFMDVPDDLTPYDAVEVHPVVMYESVSPSNETLDCDIEVVDEASIGTDPDATYFWSVYLHYNAHLKPTRHGIDCVADCRTKEEAYAFADQLEKRLRDVIGDALIPMRRVEASSRYDRTTSWRRSWADRHRSLPR